VEQQKEEKSKKTEKCKGLLDRFVVASGTGEPTEESAASNHPSC